MLVPVYPKFNPYLEIKKNNSNAIIPTYGTNGAAGFDLYTSEDVVIAAKSTIIVPTGLSMAIPTGYELQIRPRSGITLKTPLRVQLGTVDSDYRGDIGIIVDNISDVEIKIDKGTRLAQGVVSKVEMCSFLTVTELDDTVRGNGGFGSTGEK